MNAPRRKRIEKLVAELRPLLEELESLRDEEQDAYDAMPESIQGSDRGNESSEWVDTLDTAHGELESAVESLEGGIS